MGAPLTPPEGRLKKKEEKEQLNKQNVDKLIDLNGAFPFSLISFFLLNFNQILGWKEKNVLTKKQQKGAGAEEWSCWLADLCGGGSPCR